MKNLEQFINDIQEDDNLRANLAAAGTDVASVDAFLKKEGYDVTLDDVQKYADEKGKSEPSDEELRKVAGGASTTDIIVDVWSAITVNSIGAGAICWM